MKFIKESLYDTYWFIPSEKEEYNILNKLNFNPWSSELGFNVKVSTNEKANYPSREQLDSLAFIKNNQQEIIESIFDYYRKVILPVELSATDIEDSEIAISPDQLNVAFGFIGIEIPDLDRWYNKKYFVLKFESVSDPEHGICILFEDNKAIDFFSEGELTYDAIPMFNEGLINEENEPIDFGVYELNGTSLFNRNVLYDDYIDFKLKKGTYRTFIKMDKDSSDICRNFHVSSDTEGFTMRDILTEK